jgi:hypothetical protein
MVFNIRSGNLKPFFYILLSFEDASHTRNMFIGHRCPTFRFVSLLTYSRTVWQRKFYMTPLTPMLLGHKNDIQFFPMLTSWFCFPHYKFQISISYFKVCLKEIKIKKNTRCTTTHADRQSCKVSWLYVKDFFSNARHMLRISNLLLRQGQ